MTTALLETFARLIANTGPISIAHYMAESNARYYASRDPFGTAGDFITAPEISQMFGELIGLWLADMWIRAGRPEPVHYVELGPGRGTLARDALGASRPNALGTVLPLCKELLDISAEGLRREAAAGRGDSHDDRHLAVLYEIVQSGETFATRSRRAALTKSP